MNKKILAMLLAAGMLLPTVPAAAKENGRAQVRPTIAEAMRADASRARGEKELRSALLGRPDGGWDAKGKLRVTGLPVEDMKSISVYEYDREDRKAIGDAILTVAPEDVNIRKFVYELDLSQMKLEKGGRYLVVTESKGGQTSESLLKIHR